jgi:hypothetical protein
LGSGDLNLLKVPDKRSSFKRGSQYQKFGIFEREGKSLVCTGNKNLLQL